MKRKGFQFMAILTAVLMLSAGCGQDGDESGSSSESSTAQSTGSSATESVESESEPLSYPLDTDAKLTWWTPLAVNVSATSKSLNDTPFAKALIEQTGVEIEFIHPAQGQEAEQFNLLIASGKMADIVEYSWTTAYTGGMDAAIKNNLAYCLNDNLEKWAPDYFNRIRENPDMDRLMKTDEGNYYGFGFITDDSILRSSSGPLVRKDWLDDLGLDIPETVDDWEVMLRAFKEEKGATAPLVGDSAGMGLFWNNALIGAYGIQKDFYVEDGIVKYGPLQDSYIDWLTKMRDWYAEGLINPNFVTDTNKEKEANLLTGKAGASFGYAQSTMGAITTAIKDTDPNAVFTAVPYPVLNEGERPKMGQKLFSIGTPICVVNPKSENIEIAVKVLNYGYTEEGNVLYNYGIEGESFNWEDEFPTMVDNILSPADGVSVMAAWSQYARSPYNGPFEQTEEYMEQYMTQDFLKEALTIWSATDAEKYNLPPISVSTEESREYNQIRSDLDTYMSEWVCQAISGLVPLEEYESVFVPTLQEIGIEDALATLQAAYDRFLAR